MIPGHHLCGISLISFLGLFGCIGTTETSSSGAARSNRALAHPEGSQRAAAMRAPPCEPPEAATGEVTTVATAHCSGTAFENEERTLEPPDIHPY